MAHGDVSYPYEPVGEGTGLLGADDHPALISLNQVRQALGGLNLADQIALVEGLARGGADLSQHNERARLGGPGFGPRRGVPALSRPQPGCLNSGQPDTGHCFLSLSSVTCNGHEQQQVGERQIGEKAPGRHQALQVEALRDLDGRVTADEVGRGEHRERARIERGIHRSAVLAFAPRGLEPVSVDLGGGQDLRHRYVLRPCCTGPGPGPGPAGACTRSCRAGRGREGRQWPAEGPGATGPVSSFDEPAPRRPLGRSVAEASPLGAAPSSPQILAPTSRRPRRSVTFPG